MPIVTHHIVLHWKLLGSPFVQTVSTLPIGSAHYSALTAGFFPPASSPFLSVAIPSEEVLQRLGEGDDKNGRYRRTFHFTTNRLRQLDFSWQDQSRSPPSTFTVTAGRTHNCRPCNGVVSSEPSITVHEREASPSLCSGRTVASVLWSRTHA